MSSLIEQAAERLEQLRRAGAAEVEAAPRAAAVDRPLAPPYPPAITEASAAPAVSRHVDLDLGRVAAKGIVTPAAPRTRIADQFRVIKRPLIANATGKGVAPVRHGNLIMVTSALQGEGKSFTAVNLAMSIAMELDHTVMLVDADVARPSLPSMLGFPEGPGLLEVLEASTEMANVLLRTNVDKLTVLPSGKAHARATELLASESMRMLLDDIASRYADRIVIFDSPPLLLTTEARALAQHMGQIVMVVDAERTLQSDVEHALSTIEMCPIRLLLLNRARGDARAGYGYGYGKSGYGYRTEPAPGATS